MQDREFNLLEEPWIRVMKENGEVDELTLVNALCHSHEYRRLAGELPTQDVAVLRLMLAVLQTVIYRYDEEGEEEPLEEIDDAYERWGEIWRRGKLPAKLIRDYLLQWKDRFWLFDQERPFYQVPEAVLGTECKTAKLNGAISESNNKSRLFASRAGKQKETMSYAEAARWLLYVNGYDDTSAKPKQKGLPSAGAGWLGKLGLIYADGNNLYETLMLNLVVTDLRDNKCWEKPKPVWELEKARSGERTEIAVPDNQAGLLTLQSRRLLLKRQEMGVCGYYVLGGDFFPKEAAGLEQMTLWLKVEQKGKEMPYVQPKRHSPEKQMWREFANIIVSDQAGREAGIIKWVAFLRKRKMIDQKNMICFKTAGVQYGDKDFFVKDILGDHLEFHTELLTESGKELILVIKEEIERCERAARLVSQLIEELKKAAGDHSAQRNQYGQEQYFYQIDMPFRKWLEKLEPEQEDISEYIEKVRAEWRITAYQIAEYLGREYIEQAGETAFIGREIKEKKDGIEKINFYSSSSAFNKFLWGLKKCFEQ